MNGLGRRLSASQLSTNRCWRFSVVHDCEVAVLPDSYGKAKKLSTLQHNVRNELGVV